MNNQTYLVHATEAELSTAVQNNLFELFRSMQFLPGYEIVESDSLSRHYAFPTNPMFRGIWRARLSPGDVEAGIDEALAWFEKRKAQDLFWWTDSQTQPTDLPESLLKLGFDGNLEGDPGMVADLYALNENIPTLKNFSIVKAVNQRTLEDWRDVFTVSFETRAPAGQAWIDATLSAQPEHVPWELYVGYMDNKPVSTSMLFNGAGVAGIYAIGTLPEARQKGFGAAITLKSLLDARELGYHYSVLFSTHLGYPVYKRLGFREVDCKIGVYVMEKD